MSASPTVSSGRLLALAALMLALACPVAWAVGDQTPDSTAIDFINHVAVGTASCDTCLPVVCPGEPVVVTVSGSLPNRCYSFRGLFELPVAAPFTALQAVFHVDSCETLCVREPVFFTGTVTLPGLAPGPSSFVLSQVLRTCPDSSLLAVSEPRTVFYDVLPDCSPPVDSLVQTFVTVDVVPERRCNGDELSLRLAENGCPPCVHLTGFTIDPLTGGFHASLEWTPSCYEFRCASDTLFAPLGRFAAGFFSILGDVSVKVHGTFNPDSQIVFQKRVDFAVARCDSDTTARCLFPFLLRGALRTACAVTAPPGGRGELALSIAPPVPLGGLEGVIDCTAPFRVARVRAFPGLTGLNVWYQAQPDGRSVRYIVLADPGHAISPPKGPLLQVEVAADADALPGSYGNLTPRITLASDPNGVRVPLCTIIPTVVFAIPLCVTDAEVCDVNGDSQSDVRDLVLMSRCFLLADLPVDDSTRYCRDCNIDNLFTFDDLWCCARHILRAPYLPRDSVRASDRLRVSIDPPQPFGDGLLVPIRVSGADALGAALIRLRYPAERWQASPPVLPVARAEADAGWFSLQDFEQPGLVHLGGIRLNPDASDDIEFRVLFTPIGTPQPGDQLAAELADLAAPDGTVMTPPALPTISLGPAPGPDLTSVSLALAGPNPFASSTGFAVSLPRAAHVDLAVHDVVGRRIATLASGTFGPGRPVFRWNAEGARDGLYFVRLNVDGRVFSTRVALLRNTP